MIEFEGQDFYPIDLGAISEGWARAWVGDVCATIQSGFASGRHHREVKGVPHLRPMNVSRTGMLDLSDVKYVEAGTDDRRVELGDVLFNNTNSPVLVGKTCVITVSDELAYSNHMTRLRPAPGIEPRFLAHQLHYLWMSGFFMHRCVKHVNQASVASKVLARSVPLAIPPMREQVGIADAIDSYLSRLDDAVAGLERVQRNLKRYRASVLHAAVEGRLVPTEAELARAEGRDYEPASELLKRILAERRRRWEEAELETLKARGKAPTDDRWKRKYREPTAPDTAALPKLPEGWCWVTWSQIGFSQNGRAFSSSEYCETGVRLLRPGNLHVSGRVEWTEKNTRCLPHSWSEDHSTYVVGGNELVMNLTAQSLKDEFLGRICITAPSERCLLNQRIARLTPIAIAPRFMLWWFKSPPFRRFVESLNTGSLIQHMFTSQLEECAFPLPPTTEQERIVAMIERHWSTADAIEHASTTSQARAAQVRAGVLAWAFEGKLVDQDPTDEPAAVLLDRIRKSREVNGEKAKGRSHSRKRARA